MIAVRVVHDARRVRAEASAGWAAFDEGGSAVPVGQSAGPIEAQATRDGVLVVQRQRIGCRWLDLTPGEPAEWQVRAEVGGKEVSGRYAGALRLIPKRSGRLDVVTVVDIEEYLSGVVAAEAARSFSAETLKAQAIAARTFALFERQTSPAQRGWHVGSTQRYQVYRGEDSGPHYRRAEEAVRATQGIVLACEYPGGAVRIFPAFYSAVCGGQTQDGVYGHALPEIEPLRGGVPCAYEAVAPRRLRTWGPVEMTLEEITKGVCARVPPARAIGALREIEALYHPGWARPFAFRLVGARGSLEVAAEVFRLAVDPGGRRLRSTFVRVRREGQRVVFYNGRGWGHGMGMCQWGTEGLARLGAPAELILAYYYPGSRLVRAYE